MSKPKRTHHSKPHGGGISYVNAMAQRRAIEQALADEANRIAADQQAQRMLWLAVITAADAFHIGPERMRKTFFPALQSNAEELRQMVEDGGEVYAWEKLRKRAENVSGIEIDHLCDIDPVHLLRQEERRQEKGVN